MADDKDKLVKTWTPQQIPPGVHGSKRRSVQKRSSSSMKRVWLVEGRDPSGEVIYRQHHLVLNAKTAPNHTQLRRASFEHFRVAACGFPTGMGGAACVTRTRDPIITNDEVRQT